jgi:hypothetical protein
MQRTLRMVVVLALVIASGGLLASPAAAEHEPGDGCLTRPGSTRCAVGVRGAAGAKCLVQVWLSGGLDQDVNPAKMLFVGGTSGDDNLYAVHSNVVYCGFAGNDFNSFNYGVVYGGTGDELVLTNYGTVLGGAGDDWVAANYGAFYGGAGLDTVEYSPGLCVEVETGC